MQIGLKERKPSRVIFVRHLETPATQMRDTVRADPLYLEYETLLFRKAPHQELERVGKALLSKFGYLPPDAELPIMPGQEEWGRRIGEAVTRRYGMVDQRERSPYKRTRQTNELLTEGSSDLSSAPSYDNPNIRERGFGKADIYPVANLYFVDHPEEYQAMQAYTSRYPYPKSEKRREWKRRMKRQARRYERAEIYDGKTTMVVAHSRVIGNQIEFLTQPSWFERKILGRPDTKYKEITVSTGSITVLEERSRNIITGRRRYRVVSLDEKVA